MACCTSWADKLGKESTAKRNEQGESLEQENRRLRKDERAVTYRAHDTKKSGGLLREGQRVDIYRFIDTEKAEFSVRTLCRVLGVSASSFYDWLHQPQSDHELRDVELSQAIGEIFTDKKSRYGSPRITKELVGKDIAVSQKRVARLMRAKSLRAKGERKFKHTTDSNHALPVAPNLINQQFVVAESNSVWVGDITYIQTLEGWSYLATVIDLHSRKVVGWSYSNRMTSGLICDAMDAAVRLRHPKPGLIFHSDRGSQYASRAFRRRLWRYRMKQSMSAKGNCYDNAVAESLFCHTQEGANWRRCLPHKS